MEQNSVEREDGKTSTNDFFSLFFVFYATTMAWLAPNRYIIEERNEEQEGGEIKERRSE